MTFQLFTRVQIIQYTIHWDEKERDKLWFKKLYNGNIYSKMKWIELNNQIMIKKDNKLQLDKDQEALECYIEEYII